MWMKLNAMCIVSTIKSKDVYIPGIHAPPHGARKRSARPRPTSQKGGFAPPYQEKNAKSMEKELAQSDTPVKRKIPKTNQKYHISGNWYFRLVLGIFFFTAVHWYVGLS